MNTHGLMISVPHTVRALFVLTSGFASAFGQETTRVSLRTNGTQADKHSGEPSISEDGRFVAFSSPARNLVGGDTNAVIDIFLRDVASGQTSRVSVDSSGAQANGPSRQPWISADGRYVTFVSWASNLVAADTNDSGDIFVHDAHTGITRLASVGLGGMPADNESNFPTLSADGRFVAFQSFASNLVAGDTNGYLDVFVHDMLSQTTQRASVAQDGTQGNSFSSYGWISAEGLHVAFKSHASNLVANDTNLMEDLFVHDLLTGTTERVNVSTQGVAANDLVRAAHISSNGARIAFSSFATNLVNDDTNGHEDVFIRDRTKNTTTRVSLGLGGSQADGPSAWPMLSEDGRYISFYSGATNLVQDDLFHTIDIYVRDLVLGTNALISLSSSGLEANDYCSVPAISPDGRFVAFESFATNLVDNDTNDRRDVFLRDRGVLEVGTKYCTANANSTGSPADLTASGTVRAHSGDLVLTAQPVPNQFGIFFHGAIPTQTPFGNGFLCTSSGIVRGATIQAEANTAAYPYDNSDVRHNLAAFAGTTRHFQYWFRDPAGGGAFFSTSNAVAIAILP